MSGVDQSMQLLLSGSDHLGVAVAEGVRGNTGCHIQNLPAILRIQITAFSPYNTGRCLRVHRHWGQEYLASLMLSHKKFLLKIFLNKIII